MAKKLKIKQIKSIIGSQKKHKRCMRALGFRRNYRVLYKDDKPIIRAKLRKVRHLVEWESIDEKDIPDSSSVGSGFTVLKEGAGSKKSGEG
jgi:large subunit ribosomal protein L30